MTVVVNEAALGFLLNSTNGPVGREVARRAAAVVEVAEQNASGTVIGIESRALLSGIFAHVSGTVDGARAVVGTDAMSSWHGQPFSYPAYHDQVTGRPWLTQALREVFP
jgi:hypothetical protein